MLAVSTTCAGSTVTPAPSSAATFRRDGDGSETTTVRAPAITASCRWNSPIGPAMNVANRKKAYGWLYELSNVA